MNLVTFFNTYVEAGRLGGQQALFVILFVNSLKKCGCIWNLVFLCGCFCLPLATRSALATTWLRIVEIHDRCAPLRRTKSIYSSPYYLVFQVKKFSVPVFWESGISQNLSYGVKQLEASRYEQKIAYWALQCFIFPRQFATVLSWKCKLSANYNL